MTEDRKVAAEYARYSSASQNPMSIDDQLARTRPAATAAGYEVPPDYVQTDSELSGRKDDRPGYQRVMELAREKKVNAIFVESQGRLWRSQREMHRALPLLKFWGVKVFSVSAGMEITSGPGRLLASVVGWKDEAYLEDLGDQTHRGLAGQARRGYSAGGRAFGYTTTPELDHTRLDARGQPRVAGYRRVKHPEEAPIVLRVFEAFAAGRSPRKMARQFNAEKVRPPRGTSWTASAIYGSPRLGTGILRNPLYRGQVIWNRFEWRRNPETGTRVPRLRDPSEWIVQQDESLRIVSEDLWARVERRLRGAAGTSARRAHPGGSPHRYPLSGLLVCGVCGAHYVMRGGSSYACSFHVNRGPAVCANARSVSRRLLEDRILRALREDIFAPELVEYVARQVNDGIREWAEAQRRALGDRRQLEDDLRAALAERDNIREAIRRGLSGGLTREMLEDVEARVRTAQARLDAPAIPVPSLQMLPQAIRTHLDHLDRVLRVDVDEARAALRLVFDEIVLHPMPEGLVAHLHGNIEGLISLTGDQALRVGTGGSGGRI